MAAKQNKVQYVADHFLDEAALGIVRLGLAVYPDSDAMRDAASVRAKLAKMFNVKPASARRRRKGSLASV